MADQTPPVETPEALPPGKVPVVNPYGEIGTMDLAEAHQAIQKSGFRPATPQEFQDAQDKETYGKGFGNEAKSFGLGVGNAASFGAIPYALDKTGLYPGKEQAKVIKANPGSNLLGQGVGIGGMLLAPELGAAKAIGKGAEAATEGASVLSAALNPVKAVGRAGEALTDAVKPATQKIANLLANPETSPIINRILTNAPAHALGSSLEGAAYGLGQSINESALGDPDALGEKLLSNVGYSAMFAGGIGALLGPLSKSGNRLVNDARDSALIEPEGASAGLGTSGGPEALASGAATDLLNSAPKPPAALSDLSERVRNANLPQGDSTLPSQARLEEINHILPDSQFPAHQVQLESHSDPSVKDLYGTLKESGSKEGQDLVGYESAQKQEAVQGVKNEIQNVSGVNPVTSDPVEAGEKMIDGFTNHYEAEKKELAPLFKKFDEVGQNPIRDFASVPPLVEDAVPGSAKYVSVTKDGLKLAPYASDMPFTRKVYGAVKDLIDASNNPELTLGGLRNVRNNISALLREAAPQEAMQIGKLKSSMMDYMQKAVNEMEPDLNVREAFKRYAINEENRGVIERILGGSISDRASFAKTIKPEDVIDKLFSNTVTVGAAKRILGKQEFDNALGNYLSLHADKVTDAAKNGFSSAKFATFLKGKSPELEAAFESNPKALERIRAWTDKMRILPDAASPNPSGTAKTLKNLGFMDIIHRIANPHATIAEGLGTAAKKIGNHFENKDLVEKFNQVMKGQDLAQAQGSIDHAKALGTLQRMVQKTTSSIASKTKAVFSDASLPGTGFIGAQMSKSFQSDSGEKVKQHEKVRDQINSINNDPEKMINSLQGATAQLSPFAPNTAQGVHMAATRATQFLASKLPQPTSHLPLSPKFTPSKTELAHFERYYSTVENPTGVLDQVKAGTITPESMETLQVVYPKLLNEMQTSVMGELTNFIAKDGGHLSFSKKMALSTFLGQDLDESTTQAGIASNQMALAQDAQKSQANSSQAQPVRVSQKGLSSLNNSGRLLTASQSSAQRGQNET